MVFSCNTIFYKGQLIGSSTLEFQECSIPALHGLFCVTPNRLWLALLHVYVWLSQFSHRSYGHVEHATEIPVTNRTQGSEKNLQVVSAYWVKSSFGQLMRQASGFTCTMKAAIRLFHTCAKAAASSPTGHSEQLQNILCDLVLSRRAIADSRKPQGYKEQGW